MSENKIDEDMVRYFIWAIWNFFSTTTGSDPESGTPYLVDELRYHDYTGVIGISGSQKGAVYVTMNADLIEHLLENYHSNLEYEDEQDREMIRADMAGEIANTIAGNVRSFLGKGFLISVPVVFRSPGEIMHLAKGVPGIALPIKWNNFSCVLVVACKTSVEDKQEAEHADMEL